MTFRKNQEIDLTIEDIGVNGEGIGKCDGFTFFVKDSVPGDKIRAKVLKVKKNYGYARLMEVVSPSSDRVPAACPVARQCGGCALQEMSYPAQLRFKEKLVRNDLQRIGGFSPETLDAVMQPIVGMEQPFRYRNKAQFPVGVNSDGRPVTGFYAARTHSLIPVDDCLLGIPENREILSLVLRWMENTGNAPYDEATGSGCVRHVLIRKGFATGELLVCLVVKEEPRDLGELVAALRALPGMTSISLNLNCARTNVILGNETRLLFGEPWITDILGGVTFEISPESFYQVNPVQTEKLYGKALEYASLTGKETVLDLYCGIGTISLFLARDAAKVIGVEVASRAVEDACRNASRNGIENVTFFSGKAEEVVPKLLASGEIPSPDVIVVDPPRKGCAPSLLETMLTLPPSRVVYISCDPATLARDLRVLTDGGYELKAVTPVDMFPETRHVEVVVGLQRTDT